MKSLQFTLSIGLALNNSGRGVLAFTPSTGLHTTRQTPCPSTRRSGTTCTISQYYPSSSSSSIPATFLSFASGDDLDMVVSSDSIGNNSSGSNNNSDGITTSASLPSHHKNKRRKKNVLQERKRDWINRSLTYYSTVSREAKRRENGQYVPSKIELNQYKSNFVTAKKLYFARHKIKKNQPRHAERIYRKLIDDLLKEEEEEGGSCDHAQIAISTLLLALLLQRQGEIKETRATFIRFFRLITVSSSSSATETGRFEFKECTCSAKVLQAFALFEMKQKNVKKAYALIQMAVKLDSELEPVLQWKQFRDAKKLIQNGSKTR